jgi:hypothetical protein
MEKGHRVELLDSLRGSGERGGCVAVLARLDTALCREHREPCRNVAQRGVRALIPCDLQCLATLHRLPVRIGDHRDTAFCPDTPGAADAGPRCALELDHVAHARQGFCLRRIEALDLAAEHGRSLDTRNEHPRHAHIDAEVGGPITFDGVSSRCVHAASSRKSRDLSGGFQHRDRGGLVAASP